jgi:hypothetical protein
MTDLTQIEAPTRRIQTLEDDARPDTKALMEKAFDGA